MSSLKLLYSQRFPAPLRNAIDGAWGMIPASMRFGRAYRETAAFLRQSDGWPAERLLAYQIGELRSLLLHAVRTVPHYRETWREWGVAPDAVRELSDLSGVPTITKAEIRQQLPRFVSETYRTRRLVAASTSGSTGQALHFYRLGRYSGVEWAFVMNLWSRVGFGPASWRAVMRGPTVRPTRSGRTWEVRPRTREVVFSTYHLTEETMHAYYTALRQGPCKYLHCHPSSACIFAAFLLRHGYPCRLHGVLASSESLYPHQRRLLEEAFQCRVYSFFGQSEQVALAGECEVSSAYHIQPEYGIVELLDADGRPVTGEDEVGEIVATGLINRAVPFIRYRTGDLAVLSSEECSCGRRHRLLKRIEGRAHEYVVTSDGRLVSLTGLMHGQHYEALAHIRQMQVCQTTRGQIEIRIVPDVGFSSEDEAEIRNGIARCVGAGLGTSFAHVTEIRPGPRGKHQFLVQALDLSRFR